VAASAQLGGDKIRILLSGCDAREPNRLLQVSGHDPGGRHDGRLRGFGVPRLWELYLRKHGNAGEARDSEARQPEPPARLTLGGRGLGALGVHGRSTMQ